MSSRCRYIVVLLLSTLLLAYGFLSVDKLTAHSNDDTAVIAIDLTRRFQTIEGFGGYGPQKAWWEPAPHFDTAFIDLLINDLGITILRDSVSTGFEYENDNDNPQHTELARFNLARRSPGAEAAVASHFTYLKALKAAGLEKFVVSIWSPPAWMKHNNRIGNGTERQNSAPPYALTPDQNSNQLRRADYEEFAEYCTAYIKLLKQQTGIDLYAISLQNEPRFSQWYMSSVHSPESLRDLIKVVGRRFERENIPTQIFAPEDVASYHHIAQYLQAILDDPQANRLTSIFAIHNYMSDGIKPSPTSRRNWQKTWQLAQQGDKRVWMSETSGFDGSTLIGGLALAQSMYNALRHGNVSAWIYWQMSGSHQDNLIVNGEKNFLYYIAKHFYRHIRPGMVRVRAESDNSKLLPLLFVQPESGEKVMVLINLSDQPINAEIDAIDFNSFSAGYITDQSHRHDRLMPTSNTQLIPAYSVITFTAAGPE